jgi:hypothetical protein
MTISTVSRRQMLASIPAAMTRGAAVALSATPEVTVDDPVIGRHRAARQVTQAPSGLRPPDALSHAEDNALLDWLQTPPTTLAMKEGRE